jgi:hypothetical protein
MRITIDQEEDYAKHFDASKKQSTKQKIAPGIATVSRHYQYAMVHQGVPQ